MKKILLLSGLLLSTIALTACSASKDLVDTAKSISSSVTNSSSTEASSESSDFNPQDTSDATIESISTYNDYLTMYSKITDEYLENYQNAIAGTALDDGTTIETMRQQSATSVEEQKKAYGAMGNSKIIGKDTLVQYLKDYRNGLKEVTDNL